LYGGIGNFGTESETFVPKNTSCLTCKRKTSGNAKHILVIVVVVIVVVIVIVVVVVVVALGSW